MLCKTFFVAVHVVLVITKEIPLFPIRIKLRNEKTNKLSLAVFAMIAPKGRNTTAQGSALGLALLAKQALKGRHKV